jgi:KDO2-lipid IV(A) lauroyltransferase
MVAELPRLWMGSPVHIEWEGEAHIEAALQRGKGIIFLTPHLGSFEVTAQAYAQRFGARQPMTVLFRPARKPWLQKLVASSRQRPGLLTVPTKLSGVKGMFKALQCGQSVGLLPDQVPPLGQGNWQPFFWGHGLHHDPADALSPAQRCHGAGGLGRALAAGQRL